MLDKTGTESCSISGLKTTNQVSSTVCKKDNVSEVNALKSITVTGTDRPLDTPADETKSPTAKKDKWQPSLWKQQLLNIYEMRRCRDAPVDTMGCDRISDQNAEPKVLVVFRVAVPIV